MVFKNNGNQPWPNRGTSGRLINFAVSKYGNWHRGRRFGKKTRTQPCARSYANIGNTTPTNALKDVCHSERS